MERRAAKAVLGKALPDSIGQIRKPALEAQVARHIGYQGSEVGKGRALPDRKVAVLRCDGFQYGRVIGRMDRTSKQGGHGGKRPFRTRDVVTSISGEGATGKAAAPVCKRSLANDYQFRHDADRHPSTQAKGRTAS